MLRSMTGFAARTITLPIDKQSKTNIFISIKSLNSRFFETTCKIHYQLSSLEIELTRLLQQNLYRGHIYITIQVNNEELFHGAIEPSMTTLASYVNAIDRIKKQYPVEGSLTVSNLFEIPNLFTVEAKDISESTKQAIIAAIKELIEEVIAAQQKEGGALKKDIDQRIAAMERDISTIGQSSGKLIEAQKEKVKKALQELSAETTSLADIQKHAAYVLLDKMDINEEIVRFKSHLKNLTAQLGSDVIEKGKRIDFTLQEMAREINTIAAKCSDATISSLAINIKVELEKAREQVQNIV